jgi:DNA (cytosine-5)-methyltransferase 1
MKSVELFTGAGGLALGLSRAGFEHLAVVERDPDSCATLKLNQKRHVEDMGLWPIHQADVKGFDYSSLPEGVDLLAGGVPCQPFSIGGKHKGHADERNMFPAVAKIVRLLKPKSIIIENVRGLTRQSFSKYFNYILLMLTYPEIIQKSDEDWLGHLGRLERYHTKGKRDGLYYRTVFQVLNAANYGVPQKRERVFIVAFRSDLGIEWSFPRPTHSRDILLKSQILGNEYWERHRIPKRERPPVSESHRNSIASSADSLFPQLLPWRTVRDALEGLPKPSKERLASEPALTHFQMPGARAYTGHTGSPLDEPAKTLKAGDHGVPGGENMLLYPDGSVRYFTVREAARLQTFPDDYIFGCAWTEAMRQLGNAVPVNLANTVARSVSATLFSSTRHV